MALITSISGIRGTTGGTTGTGLTPIDVVKFTAAFGYWLRQRNPDHKRVVIGRDARLSGPMVSQLVSATLQGLGLDVIDLGLSTTPTVEVAVTGEGAAGGIVLTASHNPIEWNALKLLNEAGEFISAKDGAEVLALAESTSGVAFAGVLDLGQYRTDTTWLQQHIDLVLALPLVDRAAIAARKFRVVVDAVNSTGGLVVPMLLRALGVEQITELHCEPTGHFAHNPEPLPENLTDIRQLMQSGGHDLGIVVDPDVDRLALICEDGTPFGEEYTLVAVADYVLTRENGGNTVSNLSSTVALRDVTQRTGGVHTASAVGEVNVVEMMKARQAVIGGEGNGGVIYPALHYGRDALVGIALFLSHLARTGHAASELRQTYPNYSMSKNKIELTPGLDVDNILLKIQTRYAGQPINTIDGVKIEFGASWVHLRKSNTEPIIRIYAESTSPAAADDLARSVMDAIAEIAAEA